MKDELFERRFVNHVLKNIENAKVAEKRIPEAWFLDLPCRKLFMIAIHHALSGYSAPMLVGDLETWLSQAKTLTDDLKKNIVSLFNSLSVEELDSDFELALEHFGVYRKQYLIGKAVEEAAETLQQPQKIHDILPKLKANIRSIEKDFALERTYTATLEEGAHQYWAEYMDRKTNPQKYVGLFLGFDEFDKITNGLKPGNLIFIIGGWKSAKSVLALNIAYNVAQPNPARNWFGKRVLLHVNEGGTTLPKDRLVSCALGLNQTAFQASKSGNPITPLSTVEEQNVYDLWFGAKFKTLRENLILDEANGAQSTVAHLEEKIKELLEGGPLGLVIVDIFGNMTDPTPVRKEESFVGASFGKIAKGLKDLAETYQLPIIVMHHVTKAAMQALEKAKNSDENYSSTDFGLSSQPQKHADMILAWRILDPTMFDASHTAEARLDIVSTRSTEKGFCSLKIDTKIMKVTNYVVGGI